MNGKTILVFTGKLTICSITFIIGSIIGGIVATHMDLQPPPMPEGVNSAFAFFLLMLESPLMVFALALIASGLGDGLLPRAPALSFFTWVTYTLNTAVEPVAFTTTTLSGALFTAVSFLVPGLLCGLVAARLFPSEEQPESLSTLARRFFGRRTARGRLWRIGLAAVIFAPIYLLFGSIVAPLTAGAFAQERARRLLVPFLFGLFFLSPIQVYIERLHYHQFNGSFLQFLPHSFDGLYLDYAGEGNFAWFGIHLWYLGALLIYSLLLLPLFLTLSRRTWRERLTRLGARLDNPGPLLLTALPLMCHSTLNSSGIGWRKLGG